MIRDLKEVEELHGRAKIRNFSSSFLNTRREISYLQAAMSCSIYYINTTEIPKHFFVVKNAIYYVAIATVIFSRVKVTCFFTCGDIMLSRESSPGISLVFI